MTTAQEEPKTGIRFIDKIFFDAETNRYGIISMLLIAVGCLRGVGVGTGGLGYTVEFYVYITPLITYYHLYNFQVQKRDLQE